ncbi:hypothetical protein [Streptomyces sp. NPDC004285]
MTDRALTSWDPVTLLRGLARGLYVAPGYVDLYAHTLWALMVRFPWLPQAAGPLAGPLRERTAQTVRSCRHDPGGSWAGSTTVSITTADVRRTPMADDDTARDTARGTASFISELGVLKQVARHAGARTADELGGDEAR